MPAQEFSPVGQVLSFAEQVAAAQTLEERLNLKAPEVVWAKLPDRLPVRIGEVVMVYVDGEPLTRNEVFARTTYVPFVTKPNQEGVGNGKDIRTL